ncbi:hypothetical protein PR202_ga28109 [Eleusine coracana subsp. coracana]|uniref:non-specific serine/threonine protein kinase n=1 Tax=Eleusine coracana subsp. coracana TaxID=191504 RepID=A0AAV5DIP2_ELECO|nr:hypothetical protein PR202_ga28109 [Eleusine coracana subsp. coracana]
MDYPRGHLLLAYLCLMPLDASAFSFHYDFSNPGDLERAHLLYFNDSSPSDDRIDLTLMAPGSAGRVAYAQPVRLWDSTTGRVASFTTSFTFAIGGNLNNTRGDGMAFFIGTFPPMLPPDSLAGYLGLVSNPDNMGSPPIVGVEFDTVWNDRLDPLSVIADHIGIDVNSIHSTAFTRDLPNLGLVGTMWANISYDTSSKMMVVNLRLADRRNIHNIQAPVDFRAAGVPQDAAVGFSAATGTFWDPKQVAVKRLKGPLEQTRRDYVTEIMTLGQLNHRNLVKLVGWCDGGQNSRPLLVYELMANKSVDKHLHDESTEKTSLPWPEWYKIVIGVGRAIEYLHAGCHNLIILHRDIKPSNVMLNAAFEPKLGDFGLVKRVYTGQGSLETAMFGTYDYMDPSCVATSTVNTASDMYSFGVLLLEIATGKIPSLLQGEESILSNSLVDAVRESYNNNKVLEMADERLCGEFDKCQMERVLVVGLLCSQRNRQDRPEIREAVDLLSNLSHPAPQLRV